MSPRMWIGRASMSFASGDRHLAIAYPDPDQDGGKAAPAAEIAARITKELLRAHPSMICDPTIESLHLVERLYMEGSLLVGPASGALVLD